MKDSQSAELDVDRNSDCLRTPYLTKQAVCSQEGSILFLWNAEKNASYINYAEQRPNKIHSMNVVIDESNFHQMCYTEPQTHFEISLLSLTSREPSTSFSVSALLRLKFFRSSIVLRYKMKSLPKPEMFLSPWMMGVVLDTVQTKAIEGA